MEELFDDATHGCIVFIADEGVDHAGWIFGGFEFFDLFGGRDSLGEQFAESGALSGGEGGKDLATADGLGGRHARSTDGWAGT